MGATQLQTDALSQLRSKDQLDLLDSIDQLRSEGIDYYVSLPQIIVCGDQSAGKSSVLEAISGVSFPVQSNTCTRFPTELILRRTPEVRSSVSIVPDVSRTEQEKLSLSRFSKELEGYDGLGEMIEAAKRAMGIEEHGKTFSKDLLRVEITGPERSHLTIVDLPGLIHSPTKSQTDDDVKLIKSVVRRYMKEPRSVILAVISAKNDLANQIVLKMAKKADPEGQRTMGIITKPDSLVAGSENEKYFASLAQNKEVEFRLGWHVLRNLDSEKHSFSMTKRNLEEDRFFSKSIWPQVPAHVLGIYNLRPRLSKILMKQISSELPSLIEEIASRRDTCRKNLENMGPRRETRAEQQAYLLRVSMQFQSLIKASVDGVYNDTFFEDAQLDRGYSQRLRAVIQNDNQQFARDMSARGNYYNIVEALSEEEDGEQEPGPRGGGTVQTIDRDGFIAQVQTLMARRRGRELPGTFSPMIVEDLFREQCRPWEAILDAHVTKAAAAARKLLGLVCAHVAADTAGQYIMREIVDPALGTIGSTLKSKADELLEPHKNGHPITYNHYFTETLQKVRDQRRMDEVRRTLARWLGVDEDQFGTTTYYLSGDYDFRMLMENLSSRSEPDMDRFAASEALDCMEAYYKVALKRFIDDVAIELVEAKLVRALPDIFSPMTVYRMGPELVGRIAGEPDEKLRRREELEKQLAALGRGSEICKRFAGVEFIEKLVDGAHMPASTDETINEDEMASAGGYPSEGAPASEVDSIPAHDQPEFVEDAASPDPDQLWTDQPPSPLPPSPLPPSPQSDWFR